MKRQVEVIGELKTEQLRIQMFFGIRLNGMSAQKNEPKKFL